MKKVCSLFLLIATLSLNAQNNHPVIKISSSIKADIEKVARDYYDHFFNIKGEKISETESTIEYSSKVKPAGALESTILQIKSIQNVYSWEAVMLNTEDYETAVAKYRQIYQQLNNASFIMHDNKAWKFKGDYDAPDEERGFASSILEADVNENYLKKLKIEVALNYNMSGWSVRILVYEKESDADIRPTEKEE
ncbi:MAG: hypothetical protein ACRDE8_12915 [Ginsengibacter sp.]